MNERKTRKRKWNTVKKGRCQYKKETEGKYKKERNESLVSWFHYLMAY